MVKQLFCILSVLLASIFLATTVFAEVKLREVDFEVGPGSLTALGTATGIGNRETVARLEASGLAIVKCTNQDGETEPAQEYRLSVFGASESPISDKGIQVAIIDSGIGYDNECPNGNWSASIDFVFWTEATINVYDEDESLLASQDYSCITTRFPDSVTCTSVR